MIDRYTGILKWREIYPSDTGAIIAEQLQKININLERISDSIERIIK